MRKCTVDHCERPYKARGYCSAHEQRARKGLPLEVPLKPYVPRVRAYPEDAVCATTECEQRPIQRGFCSRCIQRMKRTGTGLYAHLPRCSVEECDRPRYSKRFGYCHLHYKRLRSGIALDRPMPGEFLRRTDPKGYVWICGPGIKPGGIFEHRYVMEQSLERPLWPDENVHHINGNKSDNSLANLELWSTMQPSGQRVEEKVAWAIEILERYSPQRLGGWSA